MTPPPASTSTATSTSIPSSKELRHASSAQLQAAALQKLLKNPSKPVHLPSAPREGAKQLRPPREMMRNVQGSSAGAGSGEFHVYKESRRREYERLKLMDEQEAYNKAKQDALERQASYKSQAEAKTAKNRLKRQKKKQAHRNTSSATGTAPGDQLDQATQEKKPLGLADKKRKLGSSAAASAAFKFKSAKERANADDEDEDEDDQDEDQQANKGDDSPHALETINNVQDAITVPQVAPAKEAGVKIVDDDDF